MRRRDSNFWEFLLLFSDANAPRPDTIWRKLMPVPIEDLIDFPVSDTFRGYFYERGMTPHPPPDMGDYAIQGLRRELRELKDAMVELANLALEAPVRPPQSDYRPATAPAKAPPATQTKRPMWDGKL